MNEALHVIQFAGKDGARHVGIVDRGARTITTVEGFTTVYDAAQAALSGRGSLAALLRQSATGKSHDYDELLQQGCVLLPLDHPEPARFLLTGTGITHIGSADARNKMHQAMAGGGEADSDSMKMFRMGLAGGKPKAGDMGVQPEWFFKGNALCAVPPGASLPMPSFALAGAEEPEIVGLYIVAADGTPLRIGYALGNEFSDHITEEANYLYAAHSKLRACSFGPELVIGDLPADIRGETRIWRDGRIVWREEFLTGEANMSHSFANLEHHHFKYSMFRRPGDLHGYFFGAALLSHAAGFRTAAGDVFELEAPAFGKALRNTLQRLPDEGLISVRQL